MAKVIGIDLGGTKINGGIINEEGEILKKITIDTKAKNGKQEVLDGIAHVIKELIKNEKIEGIGIGTPGFIDTEKGQVLYHGGNIYDWVGVNLKKEIARYFPDVPVFVENDANVAAICEGWVGAGKGLDSFIMLTLGTGLGGGIWDKKTGIWHGSNYQGAELGHSILYPNGRQCNCGQKGCAEQYISGTGIENTYREITGKVLTGEEIFENSTDVDSKRTINRFTKDLATFLVTIKNIFDPHGLIIGGGVINSRDKWWDKMIEKYRISCNSPEGMEILPARYLNDAGIIGAAKIAFEHIKL